MKKVDTERRPYAPRRYVRIKGGWIVEVTRTGRNAVLGFRVDRCGNKVVREGRTYEQQFLHVFPPKDIVAELRLNLHYGELEKVDQ